ncbi:MAG: sensor histidine kinase KdpD [Firmicutes bacterium]|nr:sensor histidine kinase KdpD [Bacillota bacterium]
MNNGNNPRGKLKIFLGAAAGVGKTCAMLNEAHRRKSRGEDIAIGIVVTHGRAETAKLTQGLESIPLKKITYREQLFEEMDTQAVISRKPEIVLVDELAHTNIPGSNHAKRWQSVQDLLNAGINVLSTLNVQHLESLNDQVYEITGVRVRETIPDNFLDEADEISLIDVTADTLISRLQRGEIYSRDKIKTALENFFRPENLNGLREIALRIAADEVDEKLQDYMKEKYDRFSPVEKAAVFVKLKKEHIRIIRRAYRFFRRLDADFQVINFKYPGSTLTRQEQEISSEFDAFAANLGGVFQQLEGDPVPESIREFMEKNSITFAVIGRSRSSGILNGFLNNGLMHRIIKLAEKADIIVVSSD